MFSQEETIQSCVRRWDKARGRGGGKERGEREQVASLNRWPGEKPVRSEQNTGGGEMVTSELSGSRAFQAEA